MGETEEEVIGVILLNLGGPDSLQAVRPFLYNLFSDREIIRLGHPIFQKPLAFFISYFRSIKTKRLYSLIGNKSPILDITLAQAKALEVALNQNSEIRTQKSELRSQKLHLGRVKEGARFKTFVGMRYWHPFIDEVVPEIYKKGIKRLVALNLYPQYSHATTGSSLSVLKKVLLKCPMEVSFIASWFDHPLYIEALVDVIKNGLKSFKYEQLKPYAGLNVHVLFSAHNLPEALIKEGDPYVKQIECTIEEITKRLSIKWSLSYQSKTGLVKWLEPTTEKAIEKLAREGIKNVLVVPISFVSDHIETLYEIDILYKNIAEKNGIFLKRVDSLNTHPIFIEALKDIVLNNVREKGWI
ncbi:MAG: ferrochelatase [Thermodesulfovibrionales bacterium]